MGRRDFLADFQSLLTADLPKEVKHVRSGEDDGTFVLEFDLAEHDAPSISFTLQAMINDPSEYPSSHTCFIYSSSDHAPDFVVDALDRLDFARVRLVPMVQQLCVTLRMYNGNRETHGSDHDDLEMDDPEDVYVDSDADDTFGDPGISRIYHHQNGQDSPRKSMGALDKAFVARIKSDLRKVKLAGFRVSSAGALFEPKCPCYVVASIRVGRLGIEENALRAWHLEPQMYIMLIIQYPYGYCTFEGLQGYNAQARFAVRQSHRYRIPLDEALAVFDSSQTDAGAKTTTKDFFISGPLNELLNSRLLDTIKYRVSHHFDWQQAEDYLLENQGRLAKDGKESSVLSGGPLKAQGTSMFAPMVTDDHFSTCKEGRSFPLVAMQYTLRHLVRCTEFCLVCHSRLDATFEALKPYVCSRPLCLYQYMSLGFGPRIEHEICAQPNVVDLLISFCYAAASVNRLNDLPKGLKMLLPDCIPAPQNDCTSQAATVPSKQSKSKERIGASAKTLGSPHRFFLDETSSEIMYEPARLPPIGLSAGMWVQITDKSGKAQYRCITEILEEKLKVGPSLEYQAKPATPMNGSQRPLASEAASTSHPKKEGAGPVKREVSVNAWTVEFDTLSENMQFRAINFLLARLPSVMQMKEYLTSTQSPKQLKHWTTHIPPASLSLLRWIISSNRSCIIQVESTDPELEPSEPAVEGISGQYLQFRFAQGAPDKEQRFENAVQEVSVKRKSKHRTFFAWHGSRLHNWHGIIREGLNYDKVENGRAYGDGVYHSLQANTSLVYSFRASGTHWPQSRLGIKAAFCLNEIINSPQDFSSTSPHLVIQQIDWIQTRYLFVQCERPQEAKRKKLTQALEQDSHWKLEGPQSQRDNRPPEVIIPLSAIPRSRQVRYMKPTKSPLSKRMKLSVMSPGDKEVENELMGSTEDPVYSSELSCEEDKLLTRFESVSDAAIGSTSIPTNVTPFIPDQLDPGSLPMLEPPKYACSQATKALQRELTKTLATQNSIPAHERGWSINVGLVNNIYQWIVELHSFDKELPLASDMKALSVYSIVLEFRFGPNYPYSPPFIRVIRPRFVLRMAGGGGHVTAGGAMCMELLTNDGWNPACTMESIILQVRIAVSSIDPPARLEPGRVSDYKVGEAVSAYIRACHAHGWKVPVDFESHISKLPG